ncbi:MAG: LysR family transcriptional regulator [Lachnospiraceae bacterium]
MLYKISFQQIDYFLTTAEVLNFTDAAKLLYISQPALSKQIHVLEKELGFALFIRNRRQVSLTAEGMSLYRDWSMMSKMMESSIYNAKRLNNHASGSLRISCSDTFDYSDVLPPIIRKFRSTFPHIEISVESHSFKTVRDGLMEDAFDLILTPYFELDGIPDVHWIKLKDIPLSIIIPTSNPLSSQEIVTLRDLKDEPFILISPKDSLGGNERTLALCRHWGFQLKNAVYVPNVTSLELAVKNGLGVAICNSKSFDNDPSTARVYPLEKQPEDSKLVAVWKKDQQNITLDLFTNMLQQHFQNPIH